MKNVLPLVALFAALGFLYPHVALHAQAGQNTTHPIVGLALIGTDDPFFLALKDGVKEVIEKAGGTLLVRDCEHSEPNQYRAINDFCKKKVDVILLNPTESDNLRNAVESADEAHIPVVSVDGDVPYSKVAVSIESEDLAAGQLCARYILSRLLKRNGKAAGSVEAIEHDDESPSTGVLNRLKGFYGVIKDYPEIRLVDRGEPDCFFATRQSDALQAVSDVMKWKISNKTFVVSVGSSREILKAIQSGSTLVFAVARDPRAIGRAAAEAALKILRKEKVERRIVLPVQAVDASNVEQFLSGTPY